jgi:chromosome partitioning protein
MAMVYTVAQQKGGAGKTTLAANLAAHFAATHRVALLDIDPQRSLTQWFALRTARASPPAPITFSDVSGWRLPAELDRLRATHDVLIIDTPPHVETDARIAIRAATLVLIPLQPSPPDLWAAQATLKLAAAEHRQVRLILNRTPATSRLRTGIESACRAQHLTILTATLGNRIGYANAFAAGLGITESAPHSQAAHELTALAQELTIP